MKISELPEVNAMLPKFVAKDRFLARWNIKYAYEPKYDGNHVILYWTREDQRVLFQSRTEKRMRDIYPKFRRKLNAYFNSLPDVDSLILVGELIAYDDTHPTGNLDALQLRLRKQCKLRVMVFDLIYFHGKDYRDYAYYTRRKQLKALFQTSSPYIKIVPSKKSIEAFGEIQNLEGFVAKNISTPYTAGKSSNWIKIKEREGSDFYVTGITDGYGAVADTFGALELAEMNNGKLVHVGKVGTGFTFSQREVISEWVRQNCKGAKSDNEEGWQYFMVEVVYPRRTTNNILWHPVFQRAKFPGE